MTRQPFDPDPLYVAPGPVRRRTPDPATGCGCAMVLALVSAAIVIGALIVIATSLFAAPSDASDPRSHQGLAHRGAPSTTAVSPGHADMWASGQTSGGAPSQAEIGSAVQAIRGLATWFDAPASTAAAGPALRELLGPGWRGTKVQVCGKGSCTSVVLRDWCACGDRHGEPTIIDLSRIAFARLADPGAGVIEVVVSIGDVPRLPATDSAP